MEYVYDAEREEAAFLEVNTRLQVEHPVTEAVYGVDLVAWMLRLAQGDTSVVRTELTPRGAAVEARVYAENPDRDHLPSAGTVTGLRVPDGVRVDTWIEAGSEVTTHYDPLLAKVVTVGPDRDAAWDALAGALAGTRVDGVATNLGLLRSIARTADVRAAVHHTGTLAGVVDGDPRMRGRAPRHAHHRPGLAGSDRAVARGDPAVGTDGRPVVPAGQPRSRQRRRRGGPGVHARRAGPAVPHAGDGHGHRRTRPGDPRRRSGPAVAAGRRPGRRPARHRHPDRRACGPTCSCAAGST